MTRPVTRIVRSFPIALVLLACNVEPKIASSSSPPAPRCESDGAPTITESRTLPTGSAGGANAWFEAQVTSASDYQLLLDGVEIPIVRVKKPRAAGSVVDPTAGQLTPRDVRAKPTPLGHHDIVSFRIPPGTPEGKHQVLVRTCNAVAEQGITIEVLPSPAPVITKVHFVRGETYPVLFINGRNLVDAEEIILVGPDESISTIDHVTKIDSEHIRASLDTVGRYEVFVRTKSGLGGGPPGGVVSVY